MFNINDTTMKRLIFLMLILSVFMGVKTNMGWFTLYGAEFLGPISLLKAGLFSNVNKVLWVILIIFHLMVVSLIFLTNKRNFMSMLIWFPLQFIMVYALFDLISTFLLVPFVIAWIIAIARQRQLAKDDDRRP